MAPKRKREGPTQEAAGAQVRGFVQDQVRVLGNNKKLYELLDGNMKKHVFNPFFVKEQWALYEWRQNFFSDHFGSYEDGGWHTDGGDDSHAFDTIPYNITKRFDKVGPEEPDFTRHHKDRALRIQFVSFRQGDEAGRDVVRLVE